MRVIDDLRRGIRSWRTRDKDFKNMNAIWYSHCVVFEKVLIQSKEKSGR